GRVMVPVVLVAAVLVGAAIVNHGRVLLFVPAFVNGALLIACARTLRRGPSMIETYARLRHPELPASRGPFLRAVPAMLGGFFLVNITISALLALYGTLEAWPVYTLIRA